MLLGTLGASLLGNLLAGKGIVGAGSGNKKGKGIVRAGSGKKMRNFNAASSFITKLWNTNKSIIKMRQDLMVFFQETICLKNKGWSIRNKPWWICRFRHTLDCFIL